MTWKVIEGDCVEAMAAMPEASVDAIVCDPPYSLGFMSRPWDMQVDHTRWSVEALRVLKPGGHLLAFGGTRTYHRLACAIEDAGFEIRDCLAWLYGSGFPKSLDVSKAIDKAAGAEREVVGERTYAEGHVQRSNGTDLGRMNDDAWQPTDGRSVTSPATPDAERWQGWGTALKPAHEPIVMARKPLAGTVAQNCLEHGTGALNIDGTRIGTADDLAESNRNGHSDKDSSVHVFGPQRMHAEPSGLGRWPANVVLDEQAAAMLDEQTGTLTSASGKPFTRHPDGNGRAAFGEFEGGEAPGFYGDSGGASRFLYVAKASSAERNAGLDGFEPGQRPLAISQWEGQTNGSGETMGASAPQRNVHPTVKPIELMRWLVRLVTPPDGVVLDPFAGSGTTGCAAVLEGLNFVGIEREAEYVAIARARIGWWEQHPEGVVKALEADRSRRAVADSGQLGLLG